MVRSSGEEAISAEGNIEAPTESRVVQPQSPRTLKDATRKVRGPSAGRRALPAEVQPRLGRCRIAAHSGELAEGSENQYTGTMNAISKKVVVDEKGNPVEVILPWATFCEVVERLGLDLDDEAEADLREARHDLEAGDKDAFMTLSSL